MSYTKLDLTVSLTELALNKAFEDGELSTTQKEGIVTCIPKGDKPRDNIKNWRPVTP